MPQSLSQLYVHIVFHVKNRNCLLRKQEEDHLYAYIGAVIKDNGSIPFEINGVEDHIHILCSMSKNISLARLVEEIKRHSSRWIKGKDNYYSKFAWQGGYGGFSVSPSLYEKTKRYIQNQENHHRKTSFKEEYLLFLKEYRVDFDADYLWTD
ncbi:IS200/IS605 family transposase [Marinilabilia salmonicolor]|uniref:REP element-mobilizing transposase RayT n=1 Tax=Marinilabilia salmonicolor TaxID=989 RepID=A0A368UNM9_9BACT|nr:IS200/IS605 family transposase [Marinilabilia salmonicolor]RCW30408.1 REP element-mobilizing transposase RayT [Marinilabilia salmonicolor]